MSLGAWDDTTRAQRRHDESANDQRGPFERDRDRILYASAFRRLSGITQIVRAGESDVFHNRQQHTLKVAQVGRRLAERLLRDYPSEATTAGISAEVVEAACLAHDLGHPPFGHIGESLLDEAVIGLGDNDGFEGNAQSFRILTKLSVRFPETPGLDLTRATLAASLKYPWHRDRQDPDKSKKWGAYKTEKNDLEFARATFQGSGKSIEAAIMDWADDIAYSVHDLEDFHRCNAIPWRKILSERSGEELIKRAIEGWHNSPSDAEAQLRESWTSFRDFIASFPALLDEPYEGLRDQRYQLRVFTSQLIGRYVKACSVEPAQSAGEPAQLKIGDEELAEVLLLKQITRDYIIQNPSLNAQQKGQKRILKTLFETIFNDYQGGFCPNYIPKRLRYLHNLDDEQTHRARFAADCVACLTESEAIGLHGRLEGTASGSVLDPIVR